LLIKQKRFGESIEVSNAGIALALAFRENPLTRARNHERVLAALDCQFGPLPGTRFIIDVSLANSASGIDCILNEALSLQQAEHVDTTFWVPAKVTLLTFFVQSGLRPGSGQGQCGYMSIQLDSGLVILDVFPRSTWDEHTISFFLAELHPDRRSQGGVEEDYNLLGIVLIRSKSETDGNHCLCLSFWDSPLHMFPTDGSPGVINVTLDPGLGYKYSMGCFRLNAEGTEHSRIKACLSRCIMPSAEAQPSEILAAIEEEHKPGGWIGHASLGQYSYNATLASDKRSCPGKHMICDVRLSPQSAECNDLQPEARSVSSTRGMRGNSGNGRGGSRTASGSLRAS